MEHPNDFKEVEALLAELAALRADAARLEWCMDQLVLKEWPSELQVQIKPGCGCCADYMTVATTDPRVAIDAAMT